MKKAQATKDAKAEAFARERVAKAQAWLKDLDLHYVPTDAREFCRRVMHTAYLGTENSGEVTRTRAQRIAKQIGTFHLDCKIDPIVQGLRKAYEGGFQPLQSTHVASLSAPLSHSSRVLLCVCVCFCSFYVFIYLLFMRCDFPIGCCLPSLCCNNSHLPFIAIGLCGNSNRYLIQAAPLNMARVLCWVWHPCMLSVPFGTTILCIILPFFMCFSYVRDLRQLIFKSMQLCSNNSSAAC
jgi:hypothetical protein